MRPGMCRGAVQLTPAATTCGLPENSAAASAIGVPSLMRAESRQEKLTHTLTDGVSSSSRASARASANDGIVSQASRSASEAARSSQRGRCQATRPSSSRS